jgi:hypothetical protein
MGNNRGALWLLLVSQALFLTGSLIEPPSGVLMIILRVVLPLIVVTYLGLMLAGYIVPKRR